MSRTTVRKPTTSRRRGPGAGPNPHLRLLGLAAVETPELVREVEEGFPFSAFEELQRNVRLPAEQLAELVQIRPRTLARRRKEGRLTAPESDRLLRASRVFGQALELFEDDLDAALAWFATPAPALAGRTPREVAATEVGAREVERILGRLEHGIFV
jgi:putative toxin-antitoxin system antitoxin component (TIGR02293 family)